MRASSILLAVLLFAFPAKAQFPEYLVDYITGAVFFQKKGVKSRTLKYRDLLYKDDVILVGPNTALLLIDKNNYYYHLRQKGTYKVQDIHKLFQAKEDGLTQLYGELLWSKIENPGRSSANDAQRISRAIGGVNRGLNCNMVTYPPPGSVTANDSIKFAWLAPKSSSRYIFRLMNQEKRIVLQVNTCDTQIIIGSLFINQGKGEKYYWSVESRSNPCDDLRDSEITWLNHADYELRAARLIKMIPVVESPQYYLEVAQLLKANNYYDLAAVFLLRAADFKQ